MKKKLVIEELTKNILGGRGICSFCGEQFNNVSYHEVYECERARELNKFIKVDIEWMKNKPRPSDNRLIK